VRSSMINSLPGLTRGLFVAFLFVPSLSYGAHPLITDDAGTQGKGNFQMEINGEYGHDKETEYNITTEESSYEISSILSYGILENVDVVLGIPYQWFELKENDLLDSKEDGFSDVSLEVKWRFYESDGLSFAVKPGITFPTGDEERGLGTGNYTFRMYFIATKEINPWTFHINLGYVQNENKVDERENLWHASLAAERKVHEDLRLVANLGTERNPEKTSDTDPVFILGGLIYSLTSNLDLDLGIKVGLTSSETDYAFLAGVTFRFSQAFPRITPKGEEFLEKSHR
jgi:long-subunit fatty acid transport protein